MTPDRAGACTAGCCPLGCAPGSIGTTVGDRGLAVSGGGDGNGDGNSGTVDSSEGVVAPA